MNEWITATIENNHVNQPKKEREREKNYIKKTKQLQQIQFFEQFD